MTVMHLREVVAVVVYREVVGNRNSGSRGNKVKDKDKDKDKREVKGERRKGVHAVVIL
jgi:hypothetical protein